MSKTMQDPGHRYINSHFVARRVAQNLGYAGLIPFVMLALGSCLVPPAFVSTIAAAQLFYAIAILSFLGGLHWGTTLLCTDLTLKRTRIALWWGIAPPLGGVASALLPGAVGLSAMALAFVIVYLVDRRLYTWYRMPAWLLTLRCQLTCVVLVSLLMTFLVVYSRS